MPGHEHAELGCNYRSGLRPVNEKTSDEDEAYERLLMDAMHGDQLLFVRQDAVEAAWTIVEPILGDVTPVHMYEPGTWVRRRRDCLRTTWADGTTQSQQKRISAVDVR